MSCFLYLHQVILDIARKYEGKIQIAFKPHYALRPKLYEHEDWGKERTDKYYETWSNLKNGQLELGGYTDLFITSDAMIFDSSSFVIEYLYLGKPSLFTVKNEGVYKSFNEFGEEAFKTIDKISWDEVNKIYNFVEMVINKSYQSKIKERFKTEFLLPPNKRTASQNVVDFINGL